MEDITNSESNFAVIASAGSGKTFQLVLRVISLLLNNVNPKDILALTFTNEASNEMNNRIIELLHYLSGVDKEENPSLENAMIYLEPIYKRLAGRQNREYSRAFVNEVSSQKLEIFLKEYSNLNIQTIDSYVNKIINIFPFESSITPGFAVITDDRYSKLIDDVFGDMIDELLRSNDRFEEIIFFKSRIFDKSSTKILKFIKEISEFVAGNYITLKSRVDNLSINPNDLYDAILKLESLEAEIMNSVKVMQDIIRSAIDNEDLESAKFKGKKILIGNVNAFIALRFLQKIYDIKLLSDKKTLEKVVDLFNLTPNIFNLRDNLMKMLEEYLRGKGDIIKATALYLGGRLYTYLARRKRLRNILTFNDITETAYNILCVNKIDAEYRYFRLDAKINHILIDEFQDTSLLQWSIIKPLVDEAVAGKGQHDKIGSFFFVGDDKQMLYRFRGSSSNLSKIVVDEYQGRINQITLDKNYRSDRNIVNFVNELFCKITEHEAFSSLDNINIFKLNQSAVSEDDGFVTVNIIDKGSEEFINFTINEIKKLIDKGFNYRNITVLLPTNEQGFRLRSSLLQNDIPTQLITSFKLNNGNVYKIVYALISYIYFENAVHLLNYLLLKPTDVKIDDIDDKGSFIAKGKTILAMKLEGEVSVVKQLLHIFDRLHIYDRFAQEPDFEVILDFIIHNLADEFNPTIFLDELENFASSTNSKSMQLENSVKIMTINKSKGLQFDIVILPKLDLSLSEYNSDDPFLLTDSREVGFGDIRYRFNKKIVELLDDYKNAMLAEKDKIKVDKLNLLYVALTRAKHGVIIASTKKASDDDITSIQYLFPVLGYDNYAIGEVRSDIVKHKVQEKRTAYVFERYKPEVMKKEAIVINSTDTEDYYEAIKGTLLHNALFILKEVNEGAVDEAMQYAVSLSDGIVRDDDIKEINGAVIALVNNEFYRAVNNGIIFKEKVFSKDGSIYKIDFFSITDDKIILIDYKYAKQSLESSLAYSTQIKRYASILEANYNLPIESYICYLRGGDIFFEKHS